MKKILIAVILILSITFVQVEAVEIDLGQIPVTSFYDYEQNYPMDTTIQKEEKNDLYVLYDVSYDSEWGRRVPAYFMVPRTGEGPYPCIIFGHGFTGNRRNIAFAYEEFAKRGTAVFSLDFWYHGDRKEPGLELYSPYLKRMRDGLVASVIDMRRIIDFMEYRPDIDIERVGYVGGSMGGIIGALFAGSEPRVKAPVLIVGGGDWSYMISHSVVSQTVLSTDNSIIAALSKQAKRDLAPADPVNLVRNISPRPLLMINAKHDVLVAPAAAKKLFLVAGEPKKLVWFDSGHEVPKEAVIKIASEWAEKFLKRDNVPGFKSSVDGYNTAAIKIDVTRKLNPPFEMVPMQDIYAFDTDMPLLSDRVKGETDIPGVEAFHIRLLSTHGKTVSGKLYLPLKGQAPYPCVILLHDAGGKSANSDYYVNLLARNGIASVAIDAFNFTSGDIGKKPYGITGLRNRVIQTVADTRRTMDLLDKFNDLYTGSYIVMGTGMGGAAAIITAAFDERVSALIPVNTGADIYAPLVEMSYYYNASYISESPQAEESARVIDPATFIPAMRSLPMLVVSHEKTSWFPPDSVSKLYDIASEPKEFIEVPMDEGKGLSTVAKGILRFIKNVYSEEDISAGGTLGRHSYIESAISSQGDNLDNDAGEIAIKRFDISAMPRAANRQIVIHAVMENMPQDQQHTITAYTITPHGYYWYTQLRDDGKAGDKRAGDGIYTGSTEEFAARHAGTYEVCIGGVGSAGESIKEECKTLEIAEE